jgi:hypothetical protein
MGQQPGIGKSPYYSKVATVARFVPCASAGRACPLARKNSNIYLIYLIIQAFYLDMATSIYFSYITAKKKLSNKNMNITDK